MRLWWVGEFEFEFIEFEFGVGFVGFGIFGEFVKPASGGDERGLHERQRQRWEFARRDNFRDLGDRDRERGELPSDDNFDVRDHACNNYRWELLLWEIVEFGLRFVEFGHRPLLRGHRHTPDLARPNLGLHLQPELHHSIHVHRSILFLARIVYGRGLHEPIRTILHEVRVNLDLGLGRQKHPHEHNLLENLRRRWRLSVRGPV